MAYAIGTTLAFVISLLALWIGLDCYRAFYPTVMMGIVLLMHGGYDFFHGHLVDNPGMPAWWPEFCLTDDVTVSSIGVRSKGETLRGPARPVAVCNRYRRRSA